MISSSSRQKKYSKDDAEEREDRRAEFAHWTPVHVSIKNATEFHMDLYRKDCLNVKYRPTRSAAHWFYRYPEIDDRGYLLGYQYWISDRDLAIITKLSMNHGK